MKTHRVSDFPYLTLKDIKFGTDKPGINFSDVEITFEEEITFETGRLSPDFRDREELFFTRINANTVKAQIMTNDPNQYLNMSGFQKGSSLLYYTIKIYE